MINVEKLETAIGQKIKNDLTNYELLVYTKAMQLLKTGVVYSVSTYSLLPTPFSSEGKLYFIEDLEELFWSNGTNWLRLLNKQSPNIQLFSWGSNFCGQLGIGLIANRCSPTREASSSINWTHLESAGSSASAIKADGSLWTWGENICGQLGDGTTVSKCSPVREITSATNWNKVSGSGRVIASIKTDGSLWSWGLNVCGNLGDGTTIAKCSPVREISSSTNWCMISVGCRHASAIKTDGTIWGWGRNIFYALGDGTYISRCSPVREISSSTNWCMVSSGQDTTSAIKTNGSLWGWGRNYYGQLGDGTTADRCSPVSEITSSFNWNQVTMIQYRTIGIKNNGELWSWGYNNCGALGDGTTVNKCSPVREISSSTNWSLAGGSHPGSSSAIKTDGSLWNWGINHVGQLGDGTNIDKCSPVREISSSSNWTLVSKGGSSAMSALRIV